MATIAFAAGGAALGGTIGGSILGLSMATIGRLAASHQAANSSTPGWWWRWR